jgi:CHAT domain-containing protein
VIAGLWEVTDASIEQPMDRFYDELDKGAGPDAACAPRSFLLRGSPYHTLLLGSFQLYTARDITYSSVSSN